MSSAALSDRLDPDAADPGRILLAVLAEGKRRSMPFTAAWRLAMRQLQPPREASRDAAEQLEAERDLLREVRPQLQAAYEDRRPTDAELSRSKALARRRLDALDLPPETEPAWQLIAEAVPIPPIEGPARGTIEA
jgi:hypothetical protein